MPLPRVVGVFPDTQGPFRDRAAVDAVFRVFDEAEPDRVVHIGDLADFYQLSKYSRDPKRREETALKRERRIIGGIAARLEEYGDGRPVLTAGNHEARLSKYVAEHAEALADLVTLEDVMGLSDKWRVLPYGRVLRVGKLGFTHGDIVRQQGAASALAQRQKAGGSIIMGHTHRLASAYFTDGTGQYGAWEVGHVSQPNPPYSNGPMNWQQGCAIVRFSKTGTFSVDLVPIRHGRAWYQGAWL